MADGIKLRRTEDYDLYLIKRCSLKRSQSDFMFATFAITEVKKIKVIMEYLFKHLNLPKLISSRMS